MVTGFSATCLGRESSGHWRPGLAVASVSEQVSPSASFQPHHSTESPRIQRSSGTPLGSICLFSVSPQTSALPAALGWSLGPHVLPVLPMLQPHLPMVTFVTMQLEQEH